MSLFGFVQFEFGFALGPGDGRYLTRPGPDAEPERVVVLRTMGAPQRRMLRRRRPRRVEGAEEPEPVPVTRATLVSAQAFAGEEEARAWLEKRRSDAEAREEEVAAATRDLNALLRAQRAAALDPYVRDVSAEQALVVRIGHGSGDQVADGRFAAAFAVPPGPPRRVRRRVALAPQERLAAFLSGREPLLACEELVLRARADVAAGRPREAALQARVALEAVLAELGPSLPEPARLRLEEGRGPVSQAANAALSNEPEEALRAKVVEVVDELERALKRPRGDDI